MQPWPAQYFQHGAPYAAAAAAAADNNDDDDHDDDAIAFYSFISPGAHYLRERGSAGDRQLR